MQYLIFLFTTGTFLSFNFELNYDWEDEEQTSDTNHHYVDFNSHTNEVVLRLMFADMCDSDTENNCTQSKVRF